jgi:HD-GYP domain-containing protein (c-di-GMP phosphodiesterase class II)
MTLEMAMDELRRCSGTQFDPDVVAATVAAADRGDLLLVPKTGTFQVPARV